MKRLTARNIFGIWAGCVMCWDEKFRFDLDAYAQQIKQIIRHKPRGIYTTGSTGEFYALEFDEFRQMVDIQARLCGDAGMPLQIGCCADSTGKVIRLLEYAASKPQVGAAQVVLPYWMELSNRELTHYFADLHRAVPDLPLVHYNIPRAKRFLGAADYLRILDVCPSLVGVKFTYAGSHFAELQNCLLTTLQLSYFVGENLLVSAMQLGARGTYSSVVCTNPRIMLDLYAAAQDQRWIEALAMQERVTRFLNDAEQFIERTGEGMSDPVFDKGLAVACGFLQGHPRCRAPYIGWSDATVASLRAWIRENYPDFLCPEE